MDRDKIITYYAGEIEKNRLHLDYFKLEGIRTKEIISRYLTDKKLNIIDIGGGAGFYAFWLQALGHNVSLVDLSPKNIELAKVEAQQSGIRLNACEVGDATNLRFQDEQFDIALLLGPLYHLTERNERLKALSEAKRVLKPGGTLLAAVISRYASLLDGFRRNLIVDDAFERILVHDLETGIHLNETTNPEYFTTAFFHTPGEIKNEIAQSSLKLEKLVAIESVGWLIDDFTKKSKDERFRKRVQKLINAVESNDDLIAVSPHIMAVATK